MTYLIATSSPTSQIYGGGNVEEIIPQVPYIDHDVKATLASGYARSPGAQNLSEDSVLAQLSPLERWQYLARHHRGEFIIYLLALLGGAYMLVMAGIHLGLSIFPSAFAQNVRAMYDFG